MEKARAVLEAWDGTVLLAGSKAPTVIDLIARALAAEHDAALERAAAKVASLRLGAEENTDSIHALQAYDYAESAIRAMKNVEAT
jgi:hypothetical protein